MSVSIGNLILEVSPPTNPKISKPLVTSSFVSKLIAFIDCVPIWPSSIKNVLPSISSEEADFQKTYQSHNLQLIWNP